MPLAQAAEQANPSSLLLAAFVTAEAARAAVLRFAALAPAVEAAAMADITVLLTLLSFASCLIISFLAAKYKRFGVLKR